LQTFFKRREKKYLITREQGAALQELIAQRMKIDQYGEYLVQNLYYDTDNWDIIRKSIEKPFYKEKLRLRLYGQNKTDSQCYLELKKKLDGTTYKRRITIPMNELNNGGISEIVSAHDSQVSREIEFFLGNRTVSEKIYIAFKRIAYTCEEDRNLRITFDREILFSLCSRENLNFNYCDPNNGIRILSSNQSLMEIKTTGAMPLWLTRILSENKIFACSFSKYGVCYAKFIFKKHGFGDDKNAA